MADREEDALEAAKELFDSKINTLRQELSTAILNLKELKEHDIASLAEHQRMLALGLDRRIDAIEKAADTALAAQEKRFDTVNEIHSQFALQAASFLPRAEFDRALRSLSDKLDILTMTMADKTEAAAKGFDARVIALGNSFDAKVEANALKIEANNKTFGARLDDLRAFKDSSTGRLDGLNAGWVYLLGLVSLVNGLVALFLIFRHA
jgi:hypothetical protein